MKRIASIIGVVASVSIGTIFAGAGSASAAVEYVQAYPATANCQLAAQLKHLQTGHYYWCDGVYLFRLT